MVKTCDMKFPMLHFWELPSFHERNLEVCTCLVREESAWLEQNLKHGLSVWQNAAIMSNSFKMKANSLSWQGKEMIRNNQPLQCSEVYIVAATVFASSKPFKSVSVCVCESVISASELPDQKYLRCDKQAIKQNKTMKNTCAAAIAGPTTCYMIYYGSFPSE